jgi:FkbM family methyltransferase
MGIVKGSVKKLLRGLGYDLSRLPGPDYYKFFPRPEDRHKWIQAMGIRTVLDVGAHRGESAVEFHALFPQAMIYSFEPLGECFAELQAKTAGAPRQKSFNVAIGERSGQSVIHKSGYSPSSSLLAMGDIHKDAYPFSGGNSSETIEIRTLDGMAPELSLDREVLLKIDTQGYEKQVLLGATETLKRVKILIVETSFGELYQGQARFPEIYRMLEERGFEYRGSWDQFYNPKDGLPIQQDGIFIRP